MPFVIEVILFALLAIALIVLWVRVDTLQRQVQHQRDQLERHIQRGHGPLTFPTAPARPSLSAAPPATGPRPLGRPVLRVIKD